MCVYNVFVCMRECVCVCVYVCVHLHIYFPLCTQRITSYRIVHVDRKCQIFCLLKYIKRYISGNNNNQKITKHAILIDNILASLH